MEIKKKYYKKLPNGKEVYNAFLVPSSYGKNVRALFTYLLNILYQLKVSKRNQKV